MTRQRTARISLATLAGLFVAVGLSAGFQAESESKQGDRARPDRRDAGSATASASGAESVERGRYLVHNVAMCVICHSPRFASGEINRQRVLEGGRIPIESPFPRQEWAFVAPRLAGLPGGWTEERLVALLMTGQRPDGTSPQPPMPPFRMTREDARAVAAYLKSLH